MDYTANRLMRRGGGGKTGMWLQHLFEGGIEKEIANIVMKLQCIRNVLHSKPIGEKMGGDKPVCGCNTFPREALKEKWTTPDNRQA